MPFKAAFLPQTPKGRAHRRRVTYLPLDHGPCRQSDLGKPYDLVMPTMALDLCGPNC